VDLSKAEDTRGQKPTFGTCVMRNDSNFRLRLERILFQSQFPDTRARQKQL